MKIRINNDIRLNWSIFRRQEPEDFSNTTLICLEIIHPYTRVKCSPSYTIEGNVITMQYPAKKQFHTGAYMLFLQYSKLDDTIEGGVSTFTVDCSDAFFLVEKSNQSCSVSGNDNLKIVTVQIDSNIDRDADGRDGITPSIGENGNWYLGSFDTGKPSKGKDFIYSDFTEEQLLFLRSPALDAAENAEKVLKDVSALSNVVSKNEIIRNTSELERSHSELGRDIAEQERYTAEELRVKQNADFKTEEDLRAYNEGSRLKKELERTNAEALRMQAETKRGTDFTSFLTASAGQVKTEVDKVTPALVLAQKATEDANTAAINAETQAGYAKTQGDYAQAQGTGIDERIAGKADKQISYATFIGDCVFGDNSSMPNSVVSQELINLGEGVYYLWFYQLQDGGNSYQQKYLTLSTENESFSMYNDGYFHSILHKINNATAFSYKDTNRVTSDVTKFKERGMHLYKINTILGKVEYYLNGELWQKIEAISLEMKQFIGATVEIGLNGYTTKNCFVNFTCSLQEPEYKDFISTADYLYPVMQKMDTTPFYLKKGNEPVFYYEAKVLDKRSETNDYIELEIPNTGGVQKHGVISNLCSSIYSRGSFWSKFELVSGMLNFKNATAVFMLYNSEFKYIGSTNITISEPGVYYYVAKHGSANPTSYFYKYATYVITTEPCIIRLNKRFYGWVGESTVCSINGSTYNSAGYVFSTLFFKSVYPDIFTPVKKAIFPTSLPTPEIIGQKAYLKSETSSYLVVTDSINRLIWKKITV